MKKLILQSLASVFTLLAMQQFSAAQLLPSPEEVNSKFKPNRDYIVLTTPIKTQDKTKVEVAEFFWYGCIHCYRFESTLENWATLKSADVNFVQIPAVWDKRMELHAKLYYTNLQLGLLDKAHVATFSIMNDSANRLPNPKSIFEFMKRYKVDQDKYQKVFNSFGIKAKVNRAKDTAVKVGMQGTPELLINGKYRVTSRLAGTLPKMLEISDYLVAVERKKL